MAIGNFDAACPKYGESQQHDPQLGTLLHLAHCYEKAGKLASAWINFNEAFDLATRRSASGMSEPRGKTARDRAAALEGKLANLTLVVARADTPGLEIRDNETVVARAGWGTPIPVDPGTYVITARAPGKKDWSTTVDVPSNGIKVEVPVPALDDDGAARSAEKAASSVGATSRLPQGELPASGSHDSYDPTLDATTATNPQRTIAMIAGGAGVLGIGLGITFGLLSRSAASDRDAICPQRECARS